MGRPFTFALSGSGGSIHFSLVKEFVLLLCHNWGEQRTEMQVPDDNSGWVATVGLPQQITDPLGMWFQKV